jgi:hypothetical protein
MEVARFARPGDPTGRSMVVMHSAARFRQRGLHTGSAPALSARRCGCVGARPRRLCRARFPGAAPYWRNSAGATARLCAYFARRDFARRDGRPPLCRSLPRSRRQYHPDRPVPGDPRHDSGSDHGRRARRVGSGSRRSGRHRARPSCLVEIAAFCGEDSAASHSRLREGRSFRRGEHDIGSGDAVRARDRHCRRSCLDHVAATLAANTG